MPKDKTSENGVIIKSEVWCFLKESNIPYERLRSSKIFLPTKHSSYGTRVSDGLPVKKENNKWCYRAQ